MRDFGVYSSPLDKNKILTKRTIKETEDDIE